MEKSGITEEVYKFFVIFLRSLYIQEIFNDSVAVNLRGSVSLQCQIGTTESCLHRAG